MARKKGGGPPVVEPPATLEDLKKKLIARGKTQGSLTYEEISATFDVLERAVSQAEYVVGDSFTAADVYLGSGIGFGMQFGMIEKRPAFDQYWGRLSARPAALRAKEIDDSLAAQQQAQPTG